MLRNERLYLLQDQAVKADLAIRGGRGGIHMEMKGQLRNRHDGAQEEPNRDCVLKRFNLRVEEMGEPGVVQRAPASGCLVL